MEEGSGEILGGLFNTDEVVPEYPIEKVVIDRRTIACEGCTNVGFVPLRDRFDHRDGGLDSVEDDAGARPDIVVYYRNKRHSLWGHRLWNAAKYLVKRMDMGWIDVRGKTVLELGAGLGVPSLAAFHNGARLCVVTDYPDADLLSILERNVEANCQPRGVKERLPEEGSQTPGDSLMRGEKVVVVEPLLWGNGEHINKVMSYTAGAGFDVVILSDILFNHVCNDDLADTLAETLKQNPEAVGYCVFSHHRAHKQLHDLEFFDQCTARGLACEQIDEEDYPLMFPEDRGPVEVRKPVRCYAIRRRYDTAGPALGARAAFDVVIQGTGVVQAYLSAALSRSGRRVLHCDGQGDYGGAHQTLSLSQLRQRLWADGPASQLPQAEMSQGVRGVPPVAGVQTPVVLIDRVSDRTPVQGKGPGEGVDPRRVLVDLLPTTYLSNGTTIRELVRSGMARSMEFQTLSDFVLLQPSVRQAKEGGGVSSENGIAVDSEAANFEANRFPLTRSAIFSTGTLGLIEKRRVMKFLKDVAPPLAEQLHAQGVSPADDVRMQQAAAMEAARKATEQFAKEAASHPGITLSALLEKKYGLSPKALEIVTLMGEIDLDNNTPADHGKTASAVLRSVELFRQFATSIGLYGGSTPFLQPMFGASEMVQNFCRTSAVWGGVFVLHRSLRNIGVNHEKERQYAVLSNGQWVSAKIIVAPRELLPADPEGALPVFHRNDWQAVMCRAREAVAAVPDGGPCYSEKVKSAQKDIRWSRLVVVLRRPFLTWDHLEEPSIGADRGKESGVPPSVVALVRAPIRRSHGSDDKTMSAPGAVVQLTQHSHISDQTPSGDAVILHFTADAAALSQSELQEFVMKNFYLKRTGSEDNDVDAGNETRSESLPRLRFEDDDIVFSTCFTLSAVHTALDGLQVPELHAAVDKPSETRYAHPYAVEERLKLQSATEKDRKGLLREVEASEQPLEEAMPVDGNATACEHVRVVSVPTLLPGLLNDSQYMEEAMKAYQQVMSLLQGIEGDTQTKDYVFMEELPDIPTF